MTKTEALLKQINIEARIVAEYGYKAMTKDTNPGKLAGQSIAMAIEKVLQGAIRERIAEYTGSTEEAVLSDLVESCRIPEPELKEMVYNARKNGTKGE